MMMLLLLSLETWLALVVQKLQPTLFLSFAFEVWATVVDHASFDEPS
jgi:hypothetical protein